MPGTEPPLNVNQLKQGFYDAMPPTWKERIVSSGNSVSSMPIAQMVRYFKAQETLEAKKPT
jgi:hypothetical protein